MDLHYSKEYLDFEKEVKAFCKKAYIEKIDTFVKRNKTNNKE